MSDKAGSSSLEEGLSYLSQGRVVSALDVFSRVHRSNPGSAPVLHFMATSLLMLGRADEALELAYAAHIGDPESGPLQSNLLLTLLYAPGQTPESVADIHRQWGARYSSAAPSIRRQTGRRIRIGYVSNNFCVSPDAFFYEPVIEHHDSSEFEVFCYANIAACDWRSQRFEAFADHWRVIWQLTPAEISACIERDNIDLLVECSGHFRHSCIRTFALSPAPVQVSFPMYPATTGLGTIPYRLTDNLADPAGQTEHLHCETLVRLPDIYTCYKPFESGPDVGPLPADTNGFITFGCFNRLHKTNAAVLETWARIMHAVPKSRLILHHAWGALQEVPEELARFVRSRFEKFGITSDRLTFFGASHLADHLNLYNLVDVSLDPFPYTGMTTTCDSLWMGVPVLTLQGRAHISRVSSAYLTVLALEDWIARDVDSYVKRAVAKAADPDGLRELRRTLRDRMRSSVLIDASRYTRNLESAYLKILHLAGML